MSIAKATDTSQGSCYTLATHQVECDVPEASCASPNFWYAPGHVGGSGCCHCKASCENISDSCDYYDVSAGSCYDMTSHQVSCDVAEASCASPKVWYVPGHVGRSGCCHCKASCQNVTENCTYYDVSTEDEEAATTTQEEVWGCYSVTTHSCDCGVAEANCEGTWTRSCTECKETLATSSAKSSSAAVLFLVLLGFLLVDVEAGVGCYNVETHQCDCKISEAQCHARSGTWTDGCNSCDASTNTHHPECEKQYSWGCFNAATHSCECQVSERACDQAVNKSWTHECWSCCRASSWGCYVPGSGPESGCHCGIYEGACKLDFPDATWSHQCFECEVDPMAAEPKQEDGDAVLVAVLISILGTLAVAALAGTLVYWRCFRKVKEPARVPPYNSPPLDQSDVVVGRAVPGNSGNSKEVV